MAKSDIDIRLRIIEENTKAIDGLNQELRGLIVSSRLAAAEGKKRSKEERIAYIQETAAIREKIAQQRQKNREQRLAIALERQAASEQSSNLKKLQGLVMGLGFNLLFTGMAVQRLAESGLRAILTTYSSVVGEMSTFGVITGRLAASWEYLKFSIVDALMQSGLLQNIVGHLQNLVNWFNDLSPAAKQGIGVALLGLFLLGAIAQPVGMTLLGISTIISAMSWSSAFMAGLGAIIVGLGWAAAIMGGLYAITQAEGWSTFQKILGVIGVALIGAAAGAALLGLGISWPLVLLGLLILTVLLFKEELMIAFSYVEDALIKLGSAIMKYLIEKFQWAINLWNTLAEKLGFEKISITAEQIDSGTRLVLAGNEARRDELRAQVAEKWSLGGSGGGMFSGPQIPAVAQNLLNAGNGTGGNGTTNNASTTINIGTYNGYMGDAVDSALTDFDSSFAGTPYGR